MANEAQRRVVILYEHALLGEGIAKYLRDQTGVEATVGSSHHREEVRTALALGPAVVIFESSDPFERPDLSALPPDTVLIDVSAVITRGTTTSPGVAGLERILQAVRDSTDTATRPDLTGAAVKPPAVTCPAGPPVAPAL